MPYEDSYQEFWRGYGDENPPSNKELYEMIQNIKVTEGMLGPDSVDEIHIKDASINSAMIQNLAVNEGHIDNLAVTTAKIDNLAVTTIKIANGAVDNLKIDRASANKLTIVEADIQDLAVSSAKIQEASIQNAHIDRATANRVQIIDGDIVNVNASKVNTGVLNTSLVSVQGNGANLKITGNRLQVFDDQVTPVERVSLGDVNADGTRFGLRVRGADGTTVLYDENGVYNEGITDGAVTNPKIGDDAVDGRVLTANSVTTEHLVADSVTAEKLFVSSLSAISANLGTVTAGTLRTVTLDGVDGTFTGTLSSVDGTFTGSLQAVDGTFTGTLNGVDGDFRGTVSAIGLTIEGQIGSRIGMETGYWTNGGATWNDTGIVDIRNNDGSAVTKQILMGARDGSAWDLYMDNATLKVEGPIEANGIISSGYNEFVRNSSGGAALVAKQNGSGAIAAFMDSGGTNEVVFNQDSHSEISGLSIKRLGGTGSTGRWIRVARIQQHNPIDSGEGAQFTGTLYLQTDYGDAAEAQAGIIHFSFGSRGGSFRPILRSEGAININGGGSDEPRFIISDDSNGWHQLWFYQPQYSRHATFLYRNQDCEEYWFTQSYYEGGTGRKFDTKEAGLRDVQQSRFGHDVQINSDGGFARWMQNDSNYIMQNPDGRILFYIGGNVKHTFNIDGTKSGGSIEVDGENLGMSPIDGPQYLLAYVIRNISLVPEGTKVQIDPTFLKTIAWFDVWLSQGKGEVTEVGADYFIVKGEGTVTAEIKGERVGYEGKFYEKLDVIS